MTNPASGGNRRIRQRTHKSRATGAKSAKYQGFGARREGWLPLQAAQAAEMKRIWRPKDSRDFSAERVTTA